MSNPAQGAKVVVTTDPKGNVDAKIYVARTSFAYIEKPEIVPNPDGSTREKYRTQLLIPIDAPGVRELLDAAGAIKKKNGNVGKIVAIKNGDKEIKRLVEESGKSASDLQHLAGMAIISASSSRRPDIRGENIYSGCYVAAGIRLSWYDNAGNKGVSAYLNAVVKTGEGEPLGGGGGMSANDLGVEAIASTPAVPGPDEWST